MAALPTGTVTFLFTDIEGSTRLLQQLGDRYADVLADCQRLLRAAVQVGGGQEADRAGDALFATFPSAREALKAAIAAQQSVLRFTWPDGASVRVRMGLHTGEARIAATGYVGLDVHRAVRICAAGHGGQILLSDATHALVAIDLPEGVSLSDLGEHRLKDLAHPQRLFQVVVTGLQTDFPPPKTLSLRPNNLPVQLTSFIGREHEIAEVKTMFATAHLVTLTGAGGSGKTRLALQVGADLLERYRDGVWLVELAALADSALVPQAIALALGVPEQPRRSLTETLVDALHPKSLLLLLDNCEHLLTACARLADILLRACANLRILATSREGLGITGEALYPVPTLPVPDPNQLQLIEDIVQYEAVRLFTERARAALPTFRITPENARPVAQICHHLDGIPLAIELAAVRVKVLAADQIVLRLNDRFRLLTGGSRMVLPRHQTLRAAIDWSFNLLSAPERVLLRRLSVFAGGWTLEAAESVCGGSVEVVAILDLLTSLVDKSLVLVESRYGEARYRLLETVRQYARDRLVESGEDARVQTRHRDCYLTLAEQADLELRGRMRMQGLWLARLDVEHDNLRTALDWSRREEQGAEAGLRLAAALMWFWFIRGYISEGREWTGLMLARGAGTSAAARARVLCAAGVFDWRLDDCDHAVLLLEDSLGMFRQLGDTEGTGFALHFLAHTAEARGSFDQAAARFQESLAHYRQVGSDWGLAQTLHCLGRVNLYQGNPTLAGERFEEALACFRRAGDQLHLAGPIRGLASVAEAQGDTGRAAALGEEALRIAREMGDTVVVRTTVLLLGRLTLRQGDYVRGALRVRESLEMARQVSDREGISSCFRWLAWAAMGQQRPQRAARLFGAAEALHETHRMVAPPSERAEYDSKVNTLRAILGEETLAVCWAEGRAMTLEQAIEYALAEST